MAVRTVRDRAPALAAPRRTGLSDRTRRGLAAWGFALPFLALFLTFTAGPVLASLLMSFTDLRSSDLRDPLAVDFVGLDNYARLLQDEVFLQAAANTLYFVSAGVPLTILCALGVAVLLDKGVTRLRAFFRLGFYLPVVTSIVAVAVVWRFLLQPETGPVNQLLRLAGIDGPHWLTDPVWAMPALIVMAAWRNMGYLMVVFLAGLQAIPRELYEAAQVDGAGAWARFRRITLPMLRPTLLFGAVITGIGYLQFFEEPLVMTRGGPLNTTMSVSYAIYDQFGFGNYDYASAMSYALFVAIIVLTFVQFRLLRPRT
ncbi:carbohydrate ABC transporter permease [Planobispora siamensis]|uniref:Sugar ABC transporter permease n=1 Tax=Planobispora siamensis TaxID=936338 RepID=A0A8J3SR32_9ACTN|nr:sugar ABC transporter permease [Planobispora siamensis]GIH96849.1 sugar ABC transporter permease [Planobispora siamensis]